MQRREITCKRCGRKFIDEIHGFGGRVLLGAILAPLTYGISLALPFVEEKHRELCPLCDPRPGSGE